MTDAPRQIEVNGLRVGYHREGEGQPVVFLHGFFGDHRIWRRMFDLADEYEVVAWDAPGSGDSSTPPADWRLSDYASCLAAFLSALELQRPHLVGNSFGGSLALQLYALDPSLVKSLVLADTYAGWSGSFPPEIVTQRLSNSLPDLDLPVEELVAKWIPGFVTAAAPTAIVQEVSAITASFDADGMRVMIRALAEADLRDVLPRIKVPTLLIWGDADVRSPLHVAEAMRSQIPGSRLVVIAGAGHLSHVEAPDQFSKELRRFLGST